MNLQPSIPSAILSMHGLDPLFSSKTDSYQQESWGAQLQHSAYLEARLPQVPGAGGAAAWDPFALVVLDVWVCALSSGW